MNDLNDIDALVRRSLTEVAPELAAELEDLDRHVDLWRELELDSMDHLSVMTKLSEATGREIPERDYPRLLSLQAISDYLR